MPCREKGLCPLKKRPCRSKASLSSLFLCEAGIMTVGARRHFVPVAQSHVKAAFGAAVFALSGLFTGIYGMCHVCYLRNLLGSTPVFSIEHGRKDIHFFTMYTYEKAAELILPPTAQTFYKRVFIFSKSALTI